MTVRLTDGKRGRIAKLDMSQRAVCRLAEMGAVPGAHIEIVRVAPLGDPLQVAFGGSRITLRRRDAEGIFIEMDSGG